MKTKLLILLFLIPVICQSQTYYDGIKIEASNDYQIEVFDYDQANQIFRWINNNEIDYGIAKDIAKWKKQNAIYCTVPYGYSFHVKFIENNKEGRRITYLTLNGGYAIDDKGKMIDEHIIDAKIILDGNSYIAGKAIPTPTKTYDDEK